VKCWAILNGSFGTSAGETPALPGLGSRRLALNPLSIFHWGCREIGVNSAVDEPIQLPIDGVLDLHTFKPAEVKDVVLEYLAQCLERRIFQVRIIHGKGIGNIRRTVHAVLEKHPEVISFTLDHPQYGGWGATIVFLRKPAA
jgi:hypothetical protein